MLNISFKDTPDLAQYARDIGASGTFVYVDRTVLETFYAECSAAYCTAERILCRYIQDFSNSAYYEVKSQAVIDTLIKFCGISASDLTLVDKGVKRISLDMPHIVAPLLESLAERLSKGVPDTRAENAVLLLSAYKDYQSAKTRTSQCRAKLGKLSEDTYAGWGVDLSTVNFRYVMSETGRFYTKDDSIQNWPLEIVPAISANKDYFLFWCDFDQIDMRVGYHLFLREPGSDVDKIYLAADDKYRAMYEIICKAANKPPNYDLFQQYRKSYKKAILSAMYNASEKSLIEDIKNHELAHELFSFFQHNARYQHYRRLIDKAIQFNVDLSVRDYFGFERDIPMPSLKNNREINDAISKCCNTPVQSTSNSIVILWVESVLAAFEKLGYKRGTDVQPYLIRHDECVFKIHKSVLKDFWVFKDCMQIAIDDWDILTLEPHCGISYKKPFDALEDAYEQSCLGNADKISPRVISSARDVPYRPIDEVLEIYSYSFTGFMEHAKELANDTSISLDEAEKVIAAAAETNPFYAELLDFRDLVVIYSSKQDKYKLVPNIDYAVACAKKIGTNKVVGYSLTKTSAVRYKDIMFRFKSDIPERVKTIMRTMRDRGFPMDEWVAIGDCSG